MGHDCLPGDRDIGHLQRSGPCHSDKCVLTWSPTRTLLASSDDLASVVPF